MALFSRIVTGGRWPVLSLLLAGTIGLAPPAAACTSFTIKAKNGGVVYGRTMEFGFKLDSQAIVIPRQFALASSGPDGKPGALTWKAKYAAVGLNAFGEPFLVDGVNERGLAGGILYFPDYAGYADAARADPAKSLAPWDFLTWALTNFATVAEVKANLAGMSIVGIKQPTMGITPPFHYTIHDATGASLVIEPVDGILKVYDNPYGVMTNAPTFDWHMTNLRNYVKLSATNAPPLKIDGQTIASFGQGSGLLGIPGDPTPPSRFLRVLGYAVSVEQQPAGLESVRLAEHIANNFDIPTGWIRADGGPSEPLEYTQWTGISDLASKKYYVKTYDDQVLREIDLMAFDLNAKTIATAPLKPALSAPPLAFPKP
ncbi:choloylglycine hydrolase family protein [Aquabacter spiritensis]|uniref:Penicillin amidase n=1 Tax=Aquabacter spiritensis TaxID=933073 RepID=A0A4R3LME9_9HYPH|nr:choloylglycine hydrolase family protein [Aquabacter spiritensis]TCT01540.1 penicillin amidase [Aquabacter spiritensis]